MAFGVRVNGQQSSENKSTVDWKALNEYVVETCQLQNEEVLVGVISGLYDLGVQEQEDAKVEFTGSEEDEAIEKAKSGDVYFETLFDYEKKKDVRYKRWPLKPVQSVAFSVDFPDIMLDKSPFFGNESDPKPLRLLLGGEFVLSGGTKVVARPQPLSIRKNDKTGNQWSFMPNSTIYKMAVATKVVESGNPFVPQDIDKLLGKAAQFKVRVFFNKEGFYNEKCSFVAGLGRGMNVPELADEYIHIIQFDADNKEADLKQLRLSVRNTMARASDYGGSKLEAQLNAAFPNSRANTSNNTPAQPQEAVKEESNTKGSATVAAKPKAQPKAAPVVTEDESESPF